MLVYYALKYGKDVLFSIGIDVFENNTKLKCIKKDDLLDLYPNKLSDKIDMILENLSRIYLSYGEPIFFGKNENIFKGHNFYNIFFAEDDKSSWGLFQMMCDSGYITDYKGSMSNDGSYKILTSKAWSRIEELSRNVDNKQIFIAMSYSNDAHIQNARKDIKNAIKESDYKPLILDEEEYNNFIPSEIEYEIKKSKSVIVDLTDCNNGAYFEAGYALGFGKEVIQICEKSKFGVDGHFDVKQINSILWEDTNDLKKKLIARINATIK